MKTPDHSAKIVLAVGLAAILATAQVSAQPTEAGQGLPEFSGSADLTDIKETSQATPSVDGAPVSSAKSPAPPRIEGPLAILEETDVKPYNISEEFVIDAVAQKCISGGVLGKLTGGGSCLAHCGGSWVTYQFQATSAKQKVKILDRKAFKKLIKSKVQQANCWKSSEVKKQVAQVESYPEIFEREAIYLPIQLRPGETIPRWDQEMGTDVEYYTQGPNGTWIVAP